MSVLLFRHFDTCFSFYSADAGRRQAKLENGFRLYNYLRQALVGIDLVLHIRGDIE